MKTLSLKTTLVLIASVLLAGCDLTGTRTNQSDTTSSSNIPSTKEQVSDAYRKYATPAWDLQNTGVAAKAKSPGTFHSSLSTTANPSTASASDATDIRVFPSANIQAEVHLSLDRNNPDNLLMSANTYTSTWQQGYYVSNNGGSSWFGADELQNSPDTLGGDPSTAFDASGCNYALSY